MGISFDKAGNRTSQTTYNYTIGTPGNETATESYNPRRCCASRIWAHRTITTIRHSKICAVYRTALMVRMGFERLL